jgi:prepilin-type N-terminal cleavage/methylation domain-containing protein
LAKWQKHGKFAAESVMPVTVGKQTQSRRRAFTLLELLVVVAIIGVLAGMILPALHGRADAGEADERLSSARQLMLAWQLYASEHEDRVLPGYRYGSSARDFSGREVTFPINARYCRGG